MRLILSLLVVFQLTPFFVGAHNDTISCSIEVDSTHGTFYTQADVPPKVEKGDSYLFRHLGENLAIGKKYSNENIAGCPLFVVEIFINQSGKVVACETVQNPINDLTFNTRFFKVIQEVQWVPATCGKEAVPYKLIFPIRFNLNTP